METPLVNIIAVCHNHELHLLETLESIRNQTYRNIELIIINNLEDNCKIIIENWIKAHNIQCRFIQNEHPLSITQNFNLGLSFTIGKYFQGISCDDVLMNYKIEKQVELFESLPEEYACIYGDMNTIDKNGNQTTCLSVLESKTKKWSTKKFPEGSLIHELSLFSFVPAPSVLLKTDVIKKLGNYDENYTFEDWPMWIKLSKKGYKFAAVKSVLVNYRILATSMDRARGDEYSKSIISIYLRNTDFFNIKDQRVRDTWHKHILAQKEYSYWSSFQSYLKFIKHTNDISIKKFIRQIKPFNVRRFIS